MLLRQQIRKTPSSRSSSAPHRSHLTGRRRSPIMSHNSSSNQINDENVPLITQFISPSSSRSLSFLSSLSSSSSEANQKREDRPLVALGTPRIGTFVHHYVRDGVVQCDPNAANVLHQIQELHDLLNTLEESKAFSGFTAIQLSQIERVRVSLHVFSSKIQALDQCIERRKDIDEALKQQHEQHAQEFFRQHHSVPSSAPVSPPSASAPLSSSPSSGSSPLSSPSSPSASFDSLNEVHTEFRGLFQIILAVLHDAKLGWLPLLPIHHHRQTHSAPSASSSFSFLRGLFSSSSSSAPSATSHVSSAKNELFQRNLLKLHEKLRPLSLITDFSVRMLQSCEHPLSPSSPNSLSMDTLHEPFAPWWCSLRIKSEQPIADAMHHARIFFEDLGSFYVPGLQKFFGLLLGATASTVSTNSVKNPLLKGVAFSMANVYYALNSAATVEKCVELFSKVDLEAGRSIWNLTSTPMVQSIIKLTLPSVKTNTIVSIGEATRFEREEAVDERMQPLQPMRGRFPMPLPPFPRGSFSFLPPPPPRSSSSVDDAPPTPIIDDPEDLLDPDAIFQVQIGVSPSQYWQEWDEQRQLPIIQEVSKTAAATASSSSSSNGSDIPSLLEKKPVSLRLLSDIYVAGLNAATRKELEMKPFPIPSSPPPSSSSLPSSPLLPRSSSFSASLMDKLKLLSTSTSSSFGALSDSVLFHIHGGGFIAMNSESHETYLRVWAKELQVPIVAVDYSKAPEAAFPVAFEEVYTAYRHLLQNCAKFGTNGKKIIVTGDSAGGSFASALVLRAISDNIRVPDALALAYPSLITSESPSGSRVIGVIDPLVSYRFLMLCGQAYCPNHDLRMHPYCSPALCPEEYIHLFPPTYIGIGSLDPLFDDGVFFAKRLQRAGVPLRVDIFDGIGHAFLSLHAYVDECTQALNTMTGWIKAEIDRKQTPPSE